MEDALLSAAPARLFCAQHAASIIWCGGDDGGGNIRGMISARAAAFTLFLLSLSRFNWVIDSRTDWRFCCFTSTLCVLPKVERCPPTCDDADDAGCWEKEKVSFRCVVGADDQEGRRGNPHLLFFARRRSSNRTATPPRRTPPHSLNSLGARWDDCLTFRFVFCPQFILTSIGQIAGRLRCNGVYCLRFVGHFF